MVTDTRRHPFFRLSLSRTTTVQHKTRVPLPSFGRWEIYLCCCTVQHCTAHILSSGFLFLSFFRVHVFSLLCSGNMQLATLNWLSSRQWKWRKRKTKDSTCEAELSWKSRKSANRVHSSRDSQYLKQQEIFLLVPGSVALTHSLAFIYLFIYL